MVAPRSITPKLAEEFFDAVREYVRWAFSYPEQPLTFARYIQLSLVCGRVSSFTDPLPDDVFDALYLLALDDTHRHLKEELSAHRTYATAARCFQEVIDKREKMEKSNKARDRE
jgi:hypothetical protein